MPFLPLSFQPLNLDLHLLVPNASLLRFLQHSYCSRSPHPRYSKRLHPNQFIQRSDTSRSFNLHLVTAMLSHELEVWDGGTSVALHAIRLLYESVTC